MNERPITASLGAVAAGPGKSPGEVDRRVLEALDVDGLALVDLNRPMDPTLKERIRSEVERQRGRNK